MKYLIVLMILGVVASTNAMKLQEYFKHFLIVGCSSANSSTGNAYEIICGSCLRYTIDVMKIDQGLCKNL
ncbi:hypothetical protein HNY73_022098 [Argiope bruennichi]|uniref:Uncharacterized protein n=1 Tax=Argiope bruennichi TaxID=94029 RepID=A0A8T0E3Y6_ARGBR|nr:hypothetical protein HNY73_022098 [Argiope bruennichi]